METEAIHPTPCRVRRSLLWCFHKQLSDIASTAGKGNGENLPVSHSQRGGHFPLHLTAAWPPSSFETSQDAHEFNQHMAHVLGLSPHAFPRWYPYLEKSSHIPFPSLPGNCPLNTSCLNEKLSLSPLLHRHESIWLALGGSHHFSQFLPCVPSLFLTSEP